MPVVINDNKKVLKIQKELMEQGFIIGAIRQPTVKEAILRIIIKLDIEEKELKKALELIKQKGSL